MEGFSAVNLVVFAALNADSFAMFRSRYVPRVHTAGKHNFNYPSKYSDRCNPYFAIFSFSVRRGKHSSSMTATMEPL
ncbi:hypothetical protein SAMN04488515_1167 [Cognatiyoonia koreensis]|uniref:Uncharacterized protein n=1 Tax=Cognatiyoonia koreensis TaxID=364200 RepID=A0A1I0PFB7_9RHOB|nr:hypothetical protein SAMN04488515_1167 [Cognatiyoonia koreensis]